MTWHFSVSFFCNQKRLATIRGMAWNNQEFNDVYLEIEQQKHLPIELFLFAQKYLLNSFFVYCLASSASFYNSQYNTLPQSQKERKKFSTRDWKIKRVGASKKNSIKKNFLLSLRMIHRFLFDFSSKRSAYSSLGLCIAFRSSR